MSTAASLDGRRVLVLRHMPGERRDRVSAWLENNGARVDETNPAHGVALPEDDSAYDAMVIFGGSQSVNDASLAYLDDERAMIAAWLNADRPILGLCLGAQLVAQTLGARVGPHDDGLHEIGFVPVRPLVDGFVDDPMHVYQWHNEGFEIPTDAVPLAVGERFENQAYRVGANTWGLQFHPEVSPEIVQSWIDSTDLENQPRPGAHAVEQQVTDAAQYDAHIRSWMENFMDRWTSAFADR